jgi:hypothetical protein
MGTYAKACWQQRFAVDQRLHEHQRLEALDQIRASALIVLSNWPAIWAL